MKTITTGEAQTRFTELLDESEIKFTIAKQLESLFNTAISNAERLDEELTQLKEQTKATDATPVKKNNDHR